MSRFLKEMLIACWFCVNVVYGPGAHAQNADAGIVPMQQSDWQRVSKIIIAPVFGDPTVIHVDQFDANGEWVNYLRRFRHYLAPGQPDTVTEQVYDRTEQRWRFLNRFVYLYDQGERVSQIQFQSFSLQDSNWHTSNVYVNEYDDSGLIVKQTRITSASHFPAPYSQVSYTFVNSEPVTATVVELSWDIDAGDWVPLVRWALAATDSGVVERCQKWLSDEERWGDPQSRTTYPDSDLHDLLYDMAVDVRRQDDHDNTTEVNLSDDDFWDPYERLRTAFGRDGLPTKRVYESWLTGDHTWKAYNRLQFAIEDGRVAEAYSDNWNEETGDWDPVRHTIYSYDPIDAPTGPKPIPESRLLGNAPNPFGSYTRINYVLKARTHVMLRVYDVLGREIDTLVDEVLEEGVHTTYFDATRLPSGTYFCVLITPSYHQARTMTLINGLPTHYQF